MGAVQDRSTTDLTALKSALGVTVPDFDVELQSALDIAKEEADSYLNNPFLEREELDETTGADPAMYVDPEVERPIPLMVERGLIAYAAKLFELEQAQLAAVGAIVSGGAPAVPIGATVTSVKTYSLSVSYGYTGGSGGGSGSSTDPLQAIKGRYWQRYRLIPGNYGSASYDRRKSARKLSAGEPFSSGGVISE